MSRKKLRILVVDDDEFFRSTLLKFLAIEKYDVVECSSGEEALSKVDDSIDLVVTDIVMPGLSGIELVEKLQEKVKTKVIVMSGFGHFSSTPAVPENKSVKLAVDATYSKGRPFDELIDTIKKVTSNRKSKKRNSAA